jgi:hypothetical protein
MGNRVRDNRAAGATGPRAAADALQAMRDATRRRKQHMFRAADDVSSDTRKRRLRWRGILAVLVGVMLAPILYETTALSVARWRSLTGPSTSVSTPVLNSMQSSYNDLSRAGNRAVRSKFHDLPWKPRVVLACGAVWCVIGWLYFRKS